MSLNGGGERESSDAVASSSEDQKTCTFVFASVFFLSAALGEWRACGLTSAVGAGGRSTPTVGLEPTTTRLRGLRSAD